MILMDVGADGQIQTAGPPFFQIFLNADPTGGAVREFAVLSAAAIVMTVLVLLLSSVYIKRAIS